MLLFYINFGDRNPPYPALGSNIPTVSLSLMHGVFTESSLLKQAWGNPKEGRVGCLHQNIFTGKVTDSNVAFTSDFCNNYSHPTSPVSQFLTSPRPHPTRPRVPYLISSSLASPSPKSPHTRPDVPVPLSHSHFYTQPLCCVYEGYVGSAVVLYILRG